MVCLFCVFNIKNLNFTLLNNIKIVEFETKLFISPVILKAQKWQTTFGKYQGERFFVFINSRILLLILVWVMNAISDYKVQRLYSSSLSAVTFPGKLMKLSNQGVFIGFETHIFAPLPPFQNRVYFTGFWRPRKLRRSLLWQGGCARGTEFPFQRKFLDFSNIMEHFGDLNFKGGGNRKIYTPALHI